MIYSIPEDTEVLYYDAFEAPAVATTTTYYVGMLIDVGGYLDEQDESNNTLVADELMVITATPTWDIEVLTVATAEYTVVEADTVSYTIDLANNGNTETASFSQSLVYSTDTTIDATDTRMCTVTASTPIPAGGTTTLTGTCAAPGGLNGSYTFGVIADSNSAITETDETNNTGYDATSVAGSPAHWDLVPSNASAADTTVDWGDSVAFTYDVTNAGTTDLTGFEVGLYHSTNTAIATTDDLICTDTVTATLAAGATASYTATCDVPALSAGTYYFGVVVDPGGDVREDDETNNTAYDAAPVDHDGVDWNLEAYFVYESGWSITSGDREDYDFEVRNLGEDDITDFTIELYYSRDATITTSDTLICSFPGESIDGLQHLSYSSTCTVPSVSTYAEHYLGMLVDPDREVDETDETDNSTYSGSTVFITP